MKFQSGLICIFLMISQFGCAAGKTPSSDYKNDFFGLAIRAADHESSFEILGYGENGVKYEYDKSKMDKSVAAYGRLDRQDGREILWLGIRNNNRLPLEFNAKEDSVKIGLVTGDEFELKGKSLQYTKGARTIKSGEFQEIKVLLPKDFSSDSSASIGTIIVYVAANFPEVVILKKLPEKTSEAVTL